MIATNITSDSGQGRAAAQLLKEANIQQTPKGSADAGGTASSTVKADPKDTVSLSENAKQLLAGSQAQANQKKADTQPGGNFASSAIERANLEAERNTAAAELLEKALKERKKEEADGRNRLNPFSQMTASQAGTTETPVSKGPVSEAQLRAHLMSEWSGRNISPAFEKALKENSFTLIPASEASPEMLAAYKVERIQNGDMKGYRITVDQDALNALGPQQETYGFSTDDLNVYFVSFGGMK